MLLALRYLNNLLIHEQFLSFLWAVRQSVVDTMYIFLLKTVVTGACWTCVIPEMWSGQKVWINCLEFLRLGISATQCGHSSWADTFKQLEMSWSCHELGRNNLNNICETPLLEGLMLTFRSQELWSVQFQLQMLFVTNHLPLFCD